VFVRGTATLYCYLLIGSFLYFLNIQGNILPFLKTELDLSYRVVSLHATAIAIGGLVVGTVGNRILARFGRRPVLLVSFAGLASGAAFLTVAPNAFFSIASCALFGVGGAFVATIAYAALADIHGSARQTAINEASVAGYVFGAGAPLIMSAVVASGLNWRIALFIGLAIVALVFARFHATPVPDETASEETGEPLPAAYWAYWTSVAAGIALEFSALLWAPEFLEQVVGLSRSAAAGSSVAFVAGMLIGRSAGAILAGRVNAPVLYLAEVGLLLAGFGLYWGSQSAPAAIAGLLVIGLGVSLLFPLGVGGGMAVAGNQSDKASARFMVAFGLALLFLPVSLGSLADAVGLWRAHLLVPVLVLFAVCAYLTGRVLEARSSRPIAQAN
jgi:MFS family permease